VRPRQPIEVGEDAVLTFPEGLWGFPAAQRFCVLPYDAGHPVRWLQSLDDPALAFLAIDPLEFFAGYELELTDGDVEALELEGPHEVALLALLTVSRESGAVTTNLAAPLVINTRTRRARQVIVDDSRYVTRHLVGSLAQIREEQGALK